MWRTPIGRVRLTGMVEGASFLVLLGIAMPLKYVWGMPLAVRVVGIIHGVLFLLFCGVLADAKQEEGWSVKRAAGPLVAALLPFGPFLIDRRLREQQDSAIQG
ncbi:MAG: DUF3817 domain-containing protein [Myxococcota bacterium]|nr:DUF3817 domain-containing protein [Myxococcota bacterium]